MTTESRYQQTSSPEDLGVPVGAAAARVPGVCGELVQGMMDGADPGVNFLVTCPVDFFARARVTVYENGGGVLAPADCPKAAAALRAALAHLGRTEAGARLELSSPIPRSKGLGSSSADIAATVAAAGLALGTELPPEAIARIALSVEPSDGVMFPGIALFDHIAGRVFESLGPPPPMEIIALDFGGTVDTVRFNAVDRGALWRSIQDEVNEALRLVKLGIKEQDPGAVGRGATISARASQAVMPKPKLAAVMEFAETVGAVGVNVGHSGTIIGVLLDARQRKGKSAFRMAREEFPDAEDVRHFRMLGGGARWV